MIPFPFTYLVPETFEEAAQAWLAWERQGRKALYYTGGTEIITMVCAGSLRFDALIDLKCLPGMFGLGEASGELTLGAGETLGSVCRWNRFPLLSQCCARVADHTAQEKITLGGNLMGTVIYHEAALALMLADAKAVACGPGGPRELPVAGLYPPGPGLGEGEFLTRLRLDAGFASLPFVHAKRTIGEKIGYPLITLAAILRGGEIRAAVAGLCNSPVLFSLPLSEGCPEAQALSRQLRERYGQAPMDDAAAPGEYRLAVLKLALEDAFLRLKGEAA